MYNELFDNQINCNDIKIKISFIVSFKIFYFIDIIFFNLIYLFSLSLQKNIKIFLNDI